MGTSLKDRLPPEYIAQTPHGEVYLYRVGLLYASVCAPGMMSGDDVAAAVSGVRPTGLDHGWCVSSDETFSTGQTNPCECEEDGDRKHWLLGC